ncbi:ABC transporter permease [Rhodococcus spelaei]|uniref:ABC transporter permease n=1 Tax=Rhodococcus spelaei TaxID=2546320 RepID=A0A541BNY7_9NOCA|nr:ABC transporter permease [Rhodococcus spelaei]TQF74033.1 ABC transporter permease [Rhodococcus spelaei]
MFLSIRDLRFAKGRFALMSVVLFLISLMVVMLSGLTAGLGNQSIAAVKNLGATSFAFGAPAEGQQVSFTDSQVTEQQGRALAATPGVDAATVIGIAPARVTVDGRDVSASAFGVDGSSFAAPVPLTPGELAVNRELAQDNDWTVGRTVELGGRPFTVSALVDDSFYSHQSVVWLDRTDWLKLPTAGGSEGTVVAMRTSSGFDANAAAAATGTAITDEQGAINAIGSYTSEHGSLLLMQGMLLVVSALVVGAFFTIWTIQRGQDLAVLKAVGASTGYLLRDALGQGLVVLVLGAGLGTLAAVGLGAVASTAVPFTLTATGTFLPFFALIALGMLGATAALTRIVSVDPLTALGSAR